jgi:hypothetical protein
MSLPPLPDRIVEVLEGAGWKRGRERDIGPVIGELESHGIRVSPAAQEFMAEFHGEQVVRANGLFEFDARAAHKWIEDDDVPFLNRLVGVELCPVGFGMRMFLLITPSAEFVLLHDEWLLFHRFANVIEALDAVFFVPAEQKPIWIADPDKPIGFRSWKN